MSPLLRRTLLNLLLASLFAVSSAGAATGSGKVSHILVLHSYHPGLPWTDQIMGGIQEVLAKSDLRVDVDVEYLDTKRHLDARYFTHILDAILHYKLKGRSYDLVLISDNEALKFSLEHRYDLFRGVPIVFSGINSDSLANLKRFPQVTGVTADPDFAGVINQALLLHPQARTLEVIGSKKETTDLINFQRLQDVARDFKGKVTFRFWNDIPAEQLRSQLAEFGTGSIILINGAIRDRSGNLLSFNEQALLLRQSTKLPLYSFWDVYMGEGIVGGPLVAAKRQGETAAQVAVRILKGEPAGSIPIKQGSNAIYTFDYKELERLGIPQGHLPSGHVLINAPPSSYQVSKSQFWMSFVIFLGSLVVTMVLTSNILKRRRAEAQLRSSEQNYKQLSQQFQIILDGIPDGLTLITPDMKVIWSNKGAGNYFNKTLGSIPGEYCCKLLYNRTSICDNCPAVNAFLSGANEEAIITTPDERILEVKAFPVKDAATKITHVIMLASDITEKNKLLEENIRTSRLASIGELAAGVAHEINNPNALILLNAELVKKACGDAAPILRRHHEAHGDFMMGGLPYSEMREELPHLFAEMFESARRIKRIVDDLKDFARADAPELNETIYLNDAVSASARLVGNAIKNATDHFITDFGDGLPPFLGNLQRIEQVVVNLIMNACQSLPDKSRRIQISTYYDEERAACALKIEDEGIGIPEEDLRRITVPFFTTKRTSGGTGLGLSVSMRIVKEHGGTMEFRSTPNAGTTVCLYLPTKQEVAVA